MKNQIATKTISKIVLAGMILSMLPMNLTAKTRKARPQTLKKTSLSLSSWKTQRPSKEAIDSAIKHITKLTKRLRKINIIVTSLILGAGGLGIAAGVGLSVIGLIIATIIAPPLGLATVIPVSAAISTFLSNAAPLLIIGIMTAIVSGAITTKLLVPITGGLTAAGIITPLAFAKKLQKIEKKYPGILTGEQAGAIGKLNKIIRGPINKGIVKGMRLKTTLEESVKDALKKGTGLSKETIQNYITRSRTIRNLQMNINAYKEKIKRKKEARNKYSKWKPAWHAKNIKLIALKLNPKYTILKIRLWNIKGTLKGIHKDSRIKLAPEVLNYMKKADEITADLSKGLAEAVAAAKKRGKK